MFFKKYVEKPTGKIIKSILFIFLLINFSVSNALLKVDESYSIDVAFKALEEENLNKKRLIALDLDNTVFRSKYELSTPWWFYGMYNSAIQNGVPRERAYQVMVEIDLAVKEYEKLELVEEKIVEYIREFQNNGHVVIGLTARSLHLEHVTINKLLSLGINFAKPEFKNIEETWKQPGKFSNGIIFVGSNNKKEDLLDGFLKQLEPQVEPISSITFVDDQLKYVLSLQDWAKQTNRDYLGIRYSHEDKRASEFSMHKAMEQFDEFVKRYKYKFFADLDEYKLFDPRENKTMSIAAVVKTD